MRVLSCLVAGIGSSDVCWLTGYNYQISYQHAEQTERAGHIWEVGHQNRNPNTTVVHKKLQRAAPVVFLFAGGKRRSSEAGGGITAPRRTRWRCSTWCGSPTWRCSSLKPQSEVTASKDAANGVTIHTSETMNLSVGAGCCWWCNTYMIILLTCHRKTAQLFTVLRTAFIAQRATSLF